MSVQEETRYLIYDNIKQGFLGGNGFSSAPEYFESFVKRENAEQELKINESLSNDSVIKKCKVIYEIFEETEDEIKAELEGRIKKNDTSCYDCHYEENFNEQQEC